MSALSFASGSNASRPQEGEPAFSLGEALGRYACDDAEPKLCPCCGAVVDPLAILVDSDRQIVVCGGRSARLTGMQLALVRALADAFPRTLSREVLLAALYGNPADAAGDKIVDVLVSKIRRKLDPLGLVITTQWGVGYTLERPAGDVDPAQLRSHRFGAGRKVAATTDAAGQAAIRDLNARGFRKADIARILKLTYRAVDQVLAETGRRR